MMAQPPKSHHIIRALICAALLLGMASMRTLLPPSYLSVELAQRLFGVLLGCVVILYANGVPKALSPLIRMRCNPAVEQSLRRFCGWSLVLGGLGFVIAWLAAPIAWANVAATTVLAVALCAFLVRFAWSALRRR